MDQRYHLNLSYFHDPLLCGDWRLFQIGRLYCSENTVVDPHIHTDFYELTIVTAGRGTVFANGVPTEVKRGDVYLSLPCETHEIRSHAQDPLKYDFVAFYSENETFREALQHITEHYHSPHTRVFQDERIQRAIGYAIAEVNRNGLYTSALLEALFREVIICLIRDFHNIPPDKYSDTVTPAEVLCYKLMHYIDTHLYSMKNLEELSNYTGYSYGYLSSLFRKTTSQTLSHYYHEKKLDAAALLIAENRFKATEIAAMLNYASVYSFSKAFHKRYGLSPRAFRNKKEP